MIVWMKGIGSVLLLAGSIGTGVSLVCAHKRKLAFMEQICHQLSRMQSEVRYGRLTLQQICERVSVGESDLFSCLLGKIAAQAGQDMGIPFAEIWEREMEAGLKKEILSKEFTDKIAFLGKRIGGVDLRWQEQIWEQTVEELERMTEEYRLKIEDQNKVSVSLSTMAGMVLWLLLW